MRGRPPLLLSILVVASVLGSTAASAATPEDLASLSGEDLLARMVQRYAYAWSYQDSGVVTTVFTRANGTTFTIERPFRTAFVRPDAFRFEYTDTFPDGVPRRLIVWRDRETVREYWDVDPDAPAPASLALALAGATGVSGGSAHTVPRLLMGDEVSGRSLAELTDVERLEDAACGPSRCARITGRYAGRTETLWIDLGSLLLRRIEWETSTPAAASTTIYEPAADVAPDPSLLAFDAP